MRVKGAAVGGSDEEVETELERQRERHATFTEQTDGGLEMGGFGVVDFHTTVGGQPLLEAIPDAPKRLANGKDFWIKLQEDSLLPGFGAAVTGMQIDERREFDLNPPEAFPFRSPQNRVIRLQVELKALKRMEFPALSDELAAQIAPGVKLD